MSHLRLTLKRIPAVCAALTDERCETLHKLGAALAPISNWAASLPGAAFLAKRMLGIEG